MVITNEDIRVMMQRSPVVGRTKEYSDRTGMPERLPDHCKHADKDLILMPDGRIECYLCGSAPPGIWVTEE